MRRESRLADAPGRADDAQGAALGPCRSGCARARGLCLLRAVSFGYRSGGSGDQSTSGTSTASLTQQSLAALASGDATEAVRLAELAVRRARSDPVVKAALVKATAVQKSQSASVTKSVQSTSKMERKDSTSSGSGSTSGESSPGGSASTDTSPAAPLLSSQRPPTTPSSRRSRRWRRFCRASSPSSLLAISRPRRTRRRCRPRRPSSRQPSGRSFGPFTSARTPLAQAFMASTTQKLYAKTHPPTDRRRRGVLRHRRHKVCYCDLCTRPVVFEVLVAVGDSRPAGSKSQAVAAAEAFKDAP